MFDSDAALDEKILVFLLTLTNSFPNLTKGTLGNERLGDISNAPVFIEYKLLITINKSDVVLTGRKRLRGTLIPGENKKET